MLNCSKHCSEQLLRLSTSSLRTFSFPDDIIKPQQPLALRTSGTLLLGCARIYEFKLAMLFQDCANAMKRLQTVRHAEPTFP
jgi:hypothetical protein